MIPTRTFLSAGALACPGLSSAAALIWSFMGRFYRSLDIGCGLAFRACFRKDRGGAAGAARICRPAPKMLRPKPKKWQGGTRMKHRLSTYLRQLEAESIQIMREVV